MIESKLTKSDWQIALMNAVTDPEELLTLLELDNSLLEPAKAAAKQFPLKVPRGFLARIKKRDLQDPLLKQILPLGVELETHPGFSEDPLQEQTVNPVPGLLHKYQGRVLLTLTSSCGVNCRFCFRRHFPYAKNNPGSSGWEKALEYIAEDPTLSEVILSGGDPLVSSDVLLNNFSQKLAQIPHVKRLRFHTRMPIVLPERITEEFLTWIATLPWKIIMVMHVNHPQEINHEVKVVTQALKKAGVTLLNQSVLLKGVNDNVETLVALSETLFAHDILPYYLHVLDKVQGTQHFDVRRQEAIALHQQMAERLSGFLVPKLVCEEAGAKAKTVIF